MLVSSLMIVYVEIWDKYWLEQRRITKLKNAINLNFFRIPWQNFLHIHFLINAFFHPQAILRKLDWKKA